MGVDQKRSLWKAELSLSKLGDLFEDLLGPPKVSILSDYLFIFHHSFVQTPSETQGMFICDYDNNIALYALYALLYAV